MITTTQGGLPHPHNTDGLDIDERALFVARVLHQALRHYRSGDDLAAARALRHLLLEDPLSCPDVINRFCGWLGPGGRTMQIAARALDS
ncbi:hypothetical protein GCM10022222_17480 [Amycolatopsis ultiminotia]|uniref:Uncharacterized protein n=1 Tax=Amycolatopsis ultiminotia TaxID=543629 RepID=A0ABP6VG72_9PSEU